MKSKSAWTPKYLEIVAEFVSGRHFGLLHAIGHVNESPTMHYFDNPRDTLSMIVYMISTKRFWKFLRKVALWECC